MDSKVDNDKQALKDEAQKKYDEALKSTMKPRTNSKNGMIRVMVNSGARKRTS